MMPRIDAAETLGAVNRAVLGNNIGFRSPEDRERAIAAIEGRARGDAAEEAGPADPADLAAMGIGIANEDDAPVIEDLDAWLGGSGG
jgi:hypothetical protein